MNTTTAGALLGLALAVGIAIVVSGVIALRPPTMLERIAPFILSNASVRAQMRSAPGVLHVLFSLLRPMLEGRRSRPALELRLAQAGGLALDRFRTDQAAAVGMGICAGTLLGFTFASQGTSPACLPILMSVGGAGGAIWADRRLTLRARGRREQIARELPAVAELLAFAAAAGESPTAAVERACRTLGGELVAELQRAIGDVRGGQAIDLALRDLAARVESPEVERFIDAFVIAMERGSPLADVLRAQASDVRAAHRRLLMEKAGRKEVAMLIPVVFLILPTVVLIAVYPGLQGLQFVVRP